MKPQTDQPQQRVIYFKTSNAIKAKEVAKQFERYNIRVVANPDELTTMKDPATTAVRYFAVLEEHTELRPIYPRSIRSFNHLEPVLNRSTLNYRVIRPPSKVNPIDDGITIGSITKEVKGYLDLKRYDSDNVRPATEEKPFGFDASFVVTGLNRTYFELKELGFKLSARDHCVSEFIERFLYRKSLGDWVHNPQKYTSPIDFTRDPFLQFKDDERFKTEFVVKYGMSNMVRYVCNSGIFYRASQNRRMSNYWAPLFNAGIPFTEKPKDPIHELVYFVHDMVHHAIPDLAYNGSYTDPELEAVNRFTYITYRLLSEAVTLVAADMGFTDALLRWGYKYETIDERKIYPMFKSMRKGELTPEILFDLMRANMHFCLFGDVSEFEKHNPDPVLLDEFKSKYEKFFLQDFRWTEHNYDDMAKHSDCFEEWWFEVKGWAPANQNSNLMTIDNFTSLLGTEYSSLVKSGKSENLPIACRMIFEKMLELFIKPAFCNDNELKPYILRHDAAFRRYMMAQANIFFRFRDVDKGWKDYFWPLWRMMQSKAPIDVEQGQAIRGFYNTYLDHLRSLSLLTDDDVTTYREVFPLFEPMILSYDSLKDIDVAASHQCFAERILKGKTT